MAHLTFKQEDVMRPLGVHSHGLSSNSASEEEPRRKGSEFTRFVTVNPDGESFEVTAENFGPEASLHFPSGWPRRRYA